MEKKYLNRENSPAQNPCTEIYLLRVLEHECLKKDTFLGRSPDAAAEGCPARKGPAKRKETKRLSISYFEYWMRERKRQRDIDLASLCKKATGSSGRKLWAERCRGLVLGEIKRGNFRYRPHCVTFIGSIRRSFEHKTECGLFITKCVKLKLYFSASSS